MQSTELEGRPYRVRSVVSMRPEGPAPMTRTSYFESGDGGGAGVSRERGAARTGGRIDGLVDMFCVDSATRAGMIESSESSSQVEALKTGRESLVRERAHRYRDIKRGL
jgi:hypothetical protein